MEPLEVTKIVGFPPTKSYRKGELSQGKRVPRPYGVWEWEAEGDDVQVVASTLMAKLRPVKHLLAEVAARYSASTSVAVWWEPAGGQGGFSINSDVLKELSEYCDRVDVYFVSID